MLSFLYMKIRPGHVQGFVAGMCVMGIVIVLFPLLALNMNVPPANDDREWKTVTIGGVVTFEIPSECTLDPGAGNAYLICPTAENPTPTPEMNFSSDGITVNVHRWEGLDTPYWEHVVGSMKVVQPMERDITINVEK